MRRVMVKYKVKADQVAANEALVRAVYDELHRTNPGGIRYATFQLEDGLTFVHIASTEDGQNPLSGVRAFQQFQEGIGDRCEEAPHVSELREIGSFRLLGD